MKRNVVFVTGNPNKAKHLSELLGIEIDYHSVDLEEIQSMDVMEVAVDKAKRAYAQLGRPVLVEDQALYLNALGGFPGPFVKFMVDSSGGIESISRILSDYSDKTCVARDVFVYADSGGAEIFVGEHTGVIADQPKGNGGWGWDPIYCPDGFDGRTSAELSDEEYSEVYKSIKPIEKVRDFLHGI